MRRGRRYVEVQIHWFLVGVEDKMAVGADRNPEIQKDEAVDVGGQKPLPEYQYPILLLSMCSVATT
jgi:hypothetical protein